MKGKVAVIGLDGVGWPILDRIFKYEAMPCLKELTEKSARGILKSTVPPVTPSAWTSIATGVNPGKHGVFDFVIVANGRGTRIVNSLDVKYPRIHEMISLKGLKSVCINLPLTYPIIFKDKNCRIISDWLAPKTSYYPNFLKKYISGYPFHIPISYYKSKTDVLKGLLIEASARMKVTCSILENVDWNLFFVVYSEPDHILHRCYDEVWKGDKTALKTFGIFDQTIRKATELADLVIVVSDHGFSKYRHFININSFLNRLGLVRQTWEITMQEFSDFKIDAPAAQHRIHPKIYNIASSIKPIKAIVKKIFEIFKAITGRDIKPELPYVDPTNSRAFMSSGMSFGIHVKDRLIIDYIVKKLRELNFISNVWKREEIYHGPFVKNAGDILFLPDFNRGYAVGTIRLHPRIISERVGNWHHPDGMIAIFGQEVTPTWLGTVETFDVVPTILRFMGLPLPVDTDGTPVKNINYTGKSQKYYNYLTHWQLARQVQTRKVTLAKHLKH